MDVYTVLSWEKGKTTPLPKDWPAIIRFAGEEVLPKGVTIGERLRNARLRRGWSLSVAAVELGVDDSMLGDWERERVVLFAKHRALVAEFLGLSFDEVDKVMREVWNRGHGAER